MRTLLLLLFISGNHALAQHPGLYRETFRPQYHFTPPIHWMNDPNGLVYQGGVYHLFYQFNPFGNRWGHMSWGHATSTNLLHWQHLPLAIGEEKDTMIFSGSCVYDHTNSSGLGYIGGKTNNPPLVAIYTGHIEGKNQSQHLAYSLNGGTNWTKYSGNPVLDLGKKDFRDPSVCWYAPQKKWVMSVVWPIEKEVHFYESQNLKSWKHLGAFGPAGDTSGIWECPALFEVPVAGEPGNTKWVLMLSPAPYMQYFVGEFDGSRFINESRADKIYRPDYGPDYYAAIPYNHLPSGLLPVSIGWVNNWNYAQDIPTSPWKSAMSLPRSLELKKINGEWILLQQPVKAVQQLREPGKTWGRQKVYGLQALPVSSHTMEIELSFTPSKKSTSGVWLAAGNDHYLEIGYNAAKQLLYIDRSKAGDTSFNNNFARLSRYETGLKPMANGKIALHIYMDKSIVEIFANHGEAAMTAQIFPDANSKGIVLFAADEPVVFDTVRYWPLKSVW